MLEAAIAIAAFIVIAIVLSRFFKHTTVEKLEPLAGEQTLFEEPKVWITLVSNMNEGHAALPWGYVKVTDKRLIIGQGYRARGGRQHQLTAIVHTNSEYQPGEAVGWAVLRADVSRTEVTEKRVVIPVEHLDGAYPRTHQVAIKTAQPEAYREAFGLPEPEADAPARPSPRTGS